MSYQVGMLCSILAEVKVLLSTCKAVVLKDGTANRLLGKLKSASVICKRDMMEAASHDDSNFCQTVHVKDNSQKFSQMHKRGRG